MAEDRREAFAPVSGEEFKPALVKLWAMLLVILLMAPVGAIAALCWWYEIALPGGRVLSAQAGIVGLLAVPMGLVLSLVMVGMLVTAKRLVLGDDCVQQVSRKGVVVHIPYQNIAETAIVGQGDSKTGMISLVFKNPKDPAMLVPAWPQDRYLIQVLIYGKPLASIHQALQRRLAAFRASRTSDAGRSDRG